MKILEVELYFWVAIPACVFLIFASFLPLIIFKNFISNDSLFSEALKFSSIVSISFGSAISVCFPLFLEVLLDLQYLYQYHNGSLKRRFFILERMCLIFFLLSPSVSFFCERAQDVIRFDAHFGDVTACFMVLERIFITAPCLSVLVFSKTKVFTCHNLTVIFMLQAVCNVLLPYWANISAGSTIAFYISLVCLLLGTLCFCILVVRFVQSIMTQPQRTNLQEDVLNILCIGMILLYSFSLIVFLLTGRAHIHDLRGWDIAYFNFMMMAMTVLPCLIPGRSAHREAFDTQTLLTVKQGFLRYISHEMRTPMNVANLGIDMLKDTLLQAKAYDGDLKDLTVQVKDAIVIAVELLNDILTYEKISSSLMMLECSLQRPVDYIRSCLRIFEKQAAASNIRLDLPSLEDPSYDAFSDLVILVDTSKMAQVLRNLASNALKFTPSGGSITVKLSIQTATSFRVKKSTSKSTTRRKREAQAGVMPQGLWLRLEMVDTGVGISPENLPKVFNEIIQFDANKLQGGKGSGLGLYISRGIVDLHGGFIGVRSAGLGTGCTFIMELPLYKDKGHETDVIASSKRLVVHENNHMEENSSGLWPSLVPDAAGPGKVLASMLPGTSAFADATIYPEQRGGQGHGEREAGLATTCGGAASKRSRNPSLEDDKHTLRVSGSGEISSNQNRAKLENVAFTVTFEESTKAETNSSCVYEAVDLLPAGANEKLIPSIGLPSNPTKGANVLPDSSRIMCDLRGRKILVVDDSAISLKMVMMMLTKFGAVCEKCTDGSQAVEAVRARLATMVGNERDRGTDPVLQFDMILMDNLMPVMNGPEACKKMREMGFKGFVFGLTGTAAQEDIDVYLNCGANYVFRKPIDMSELKSVLSKYSTSSTSSSEVVGI